MPSILLRTEHMMAARQPKHRLHLARRVEWLQTIRVSRKKVERSLPERLTKYRNTLVLGTAYPLRPSSRLPGQGGHANADVHYAIEKGRELEAEHMKRRTMSLGRSGSSDPAPVSFKRKG